MARARNIKPGFFKNEDLSECTPWARLCFAGLWTLADREGRLEDRPKRVKGELFAFDTIEVEPMLDELQRFGFIRRYRAADGRALIQIVNFLKHQNPHHREPDSVLPPEVDPVLPQDAQGEPEASGSSEGGEAQGKPKSSGTSEVPPAQGQPEASPGQDPPKDDLPRGSSPAESPISESGDLIPDSGNPPPQAPAEPTAAVTTKTERGKRLPPEWVLPMAWGEWALQKYPHWTAEIVRDVATKFRNHWVAKSGKDATKLDWLATWQNWCSSSITQRDYPIPQALTAGSADKASRLAQRLSNEQRTIDAE